MSTIVEGAGLARQHQISPAPSKRSRSTAHRWVAAFIFLGAALLISMVLRSYLTNTAFAFFLGAITLTAWYSGLVQSLVITVIALLLTHYFFIPPYNTFHFDGETSVIFLVLGSLAGFISWLTDSLESNKALLEMHADQLEEQARELEAQMEESQMLAEELEVANTDLEEIAARAESASRAKTDFLAVMSHELRTPLNAIVGYSDLLQTGVSGPLTDTQRTHLSRIRSSSFHLLDLIQDVLSFSRIEAGREELRIADVDVQQIARDALSYIEQHCRGKGLQEKLTISEERMVMITDPAKLRQILLNLLNNACKFTDAGVVELNVFRDVDDIVFEVTDTGAGIAAEHLEMIFEPFTQVDQSTTRQKGGAGLGLPVSRRLAHLLGGELTVESTKGEGSTFTLRLPVQARLT